jgi:hypothetical protein
MTIFKDYLYGHKKIDALAVDTNQGEFLWVGFKQDTNGNCKLKKVSANDPSQTYFDVDLAIAAIKTLHVSGSNILIGIDDPVNYIYRFSVFNPLGIPTVIARPSGVNESPIALVEDSGFLWWLFPGNESGEYAKIVKTNTFGTFQETIDLQQSGDEVHNATSLVFKDGELWVVTNTDPVELWRVYQDSASIWTLQKNEIIAN